MNNFQGLMSGKGEMKDTYPSAAYDALKKRKLKLREDLALKAKSVKDMGNEDYMGKPERHLQPRKVF